MMPPSPLASGMYGGLFGCPEVAQVFSDRAELRALLAVEGALARAQGALGLIPADSAAVIFRAANEIEIDPAQLAAETARNGVIVPGLVAAFRTAMQAPDHAQFVHWGATSQDIMDTALTLRLQQVVSVFDTGLADLLARLADQAQTHADLAMAARTFGQVATATSFGAVVAGWGWPILQARRDLARLRPHLLAVSLSGAAGTLAAMGPKGPEVRARLARDLGLTDPGHGWHNQRDRIAGFAAWMCSLLTTLGRIGEDLILAAQSGIEEVTLASGGGSSTMPQKVNPVGPSVLVALARQGVALNSALQGAALHRQQRDAAAWFIEWLSLPHLCQITGRALTLATEVVSGLKPLPDRMRAGLEGDLGLIHAEALTFALAAIMPRPDAQGAVKNLCAEARQTGTRLPDLAARRWPALNLATVLTPDAQLGHAPAEARAFARAVGDQNGRPV